MRGRRCAGAVDQRWAGMQTPGRGGLRSLLSRAVEIALAVSGLGHTIFASEREAAEALFLALWGAVAVTYLAIGIVHVRKQRFLPQDEGALPARNSAAAQASSSLSPPA
jgi:hypothetical protein